MPVRIGQQLGEYRLVRFLGKGSSGEVFLGKHIYLDTSNAVKVLHTPLLDQEDRFLEEARQIARLSHPNIVRIHNFAIDKQGQHPIPYLVMDYAPDGYILHRHPRGTRLTPQQILLYIKQIASALDYAHIEYQLVHRDVKPENILIGQGNTLLLSDFGIAVVVEKGTQEDTIPVLGTKAYIAPEQIEGKPLPQSDQYALGIIVYEWLCGAPPFSTKDKSTDVIIAEHLHLEPPPLRSAGLNVPIQVEQVMQRVLAKDPKQRFATVSEFAREFERAFQGTLLPLVLPPPGEKEPLPLPNAATVEDLSSKHAQALGDASPASWVRSGKLPPPTPVSPPITRQSASGKVRRGSSKRATLVVISLLLVIVIVLVFLLWYALTKTR